MPETKFLNLDEIVGIKRSIQIKGKKYEVAEVGFGEVLKSIQEAKASEGLSEDELKLRGMEVMIESVAKRIPKCPREVVDSLSATQIVALSNWLNEPAESQAEAMATEAKPEGATEEKDEKKA